MTVFYGVMAREEKEKKQVISKESERKNTVKRGIPHNGKAKMKGKVKNIN